MITLLDLQMLELVEQIQLTTLRDNHVNITGVGTGIQNFAYPPVTITVNAEFDGVSGVITATPSVRGEIVDLYLYETGTGYGSTVLNFEKKPDIKIKNGKDAELKTINFWWKGSFSSSYKSW